MKLVGEAASKDAPCELGTALDHQGDHVARREHAKRGCCVEAPLCRARYAEDLHAARREGVLGVRRGVVAADDPRRNVDCGLDEPRVQGDAQLGVEDDARPVESRTVRRGSSASAVPMPTATASWRERSMCTSARASGPVTHFDAPLRVAMRPSSDSASFSET